MFLSGVIRLGRDAELRRTQSGDAVTSLAMAYDYGRKGQDGKRPTEWIEGVLYGERAEKLAPHLLKGTSFHVVLEDPHIETYQGRNGPGSKIVARVSIIDFVGAGKPRQPQQQGQQQGDDSGYGDYDPGSQ